KSLARALSHLLPMRIIVLDLGDNQLSDADATAICRSPWLPELEDLSLALNFFSGPAIVEILLAAGEASSLRRLCLLDNGLTAEAGRLIANVPILHRLESLDIRGNALRGALRPLLAACGAGRLQTLGMAVMHHDEAFATTLRDALPRSITSLDIGDNRLDEIDLTWLAGDYAAGRSFRRLSLARTLLGSGGLKTFIENYRGGPIERLQLAGNGLSDRDTVTLTEWPMIETVRSLDLSSNQFTNAGALTLANEPRLANLRELSLAHNRIGSPGVAALKASSHLAGLAKPVDVGQNTPPELYR
ncbi:MAG TPA: hypothetical protein VGE52_17865, partial [Pirellulales bacterium]